MSISWNDPSFSTSLMVPLDDPNRPTTVIIGAIDSSVTVGVYRIKVVAKIRDYDINSEYYINVTIVDVDPCLSTEITVNSINDFEVLTDGTAMSLHVASSDTMSGIHGN